MNKKKRQRAKAGRVHSEWTAVYAKSGRRLPKAPLYGLGSRARARAQQRAAAHNKSL